MDERLVPGVEAGRRRVCFGGVVSEFRGRSKYFKEDIVTGIRWWPKTLSASLFMFLATFFSTVALGELVNRTTDAHIGLPEYLFINCAAGVSHALVGTQPLLVLRPTGSSFHPHLPHLPAYLIY